MISTLSERTAPARKPHRCEECGRTIEKGQRYLRQSNTDGAQVWTYKAHEDCAALSQAYRTHHRLWGDGGDWYPMLDLAEDDHLIGDWRGRFPHAVCRLELRAELRAIEKSR
ncbi:hypothetical protein [Pseudooceanicola sp.]|uniref:hypothetical protein n=1 Tax=Pseudooceanicola sp. TaxID=1914328 RepID=UPI00351413FA